MKKYLLLFFLLLTFTLSSQIYGPAQGFPSDPVISATWYNDRLYLGTQGSGVYEFKEGFIQNSRRFEKFIPIGDSTQ